MSQVRLDQLLARLGYGSRREVKDLVRAGRVNVAGAVVKDASLKVRPADVRFDNEALDDDGPLLILMHKPQGIVCSHDPAEGQRVYDLLPARWMQRNPAPLTVGRLDKDTSGALLITTDGKLAHRLTSPRHHVDKVYEVQLDQPADPAWVSIFAAGELILEGESQPCRPAALRLGTDSNLVQLTLVEGKYHQVKRMFAALGATVVRLHRCAFAGLQVDHLQPGEWQPLSPSDLESASSPLTYNSLFAHE